MNKNKLGLSSIPGTRVHLRMLAVLQVLSEADRPVTIYEICDKTGLSRPTAIGHLRALERLYGVSLRKIRPGNRNEPMAYEVDDWGVFDAGRIPRIKGILRRIGSEKE